MFFEAQKFLILSSNYVFFSRLARDFGIIYLRILCQSQDHEDLAVLSSKSFIILAYVRSLFHFEVIFVYGVKSSTSFFCASHNLSFCEQFLNFNPFFMGCTFYVFFKETLFYLKIINMFYIFFWTTKVLFFFFRF